ncbi:hypothetical protein GCM10023346_34430 [Arthrobacter gyeryongensis]|uniref:4-hydroxythreonine-4-phosphate dehydrogenase n=1 Tax=Arthrobacter gyeryongensis TaxID=1650592 RepID=A0ABP9SKH3_9MICC
MRRIVAIADDLSGAAETAAALRKEALGLSHTIARSAQFVPWKQDGPHGGTLSDDGAPLVCLVPHRLDDLEHVGRGLAAGTGTLVLDSDNRRFPAIEAASRLRRILCTLAESDPAATVFLKVDSLLRGPVASQLAVFAADGPVLLAPALPPLNRTTVNGTVHHGGVPLHETTLWHAEPSAPPTTIAATIAPLTSAIVDLATVRSDKKALKVALETASAGRPFPIVICDAETSADLDAIVSAALEIPKIRFAGASALGGALARSPGWPPRQPSAMPSANGNVPGSGHNVGSPLLVVGSASAPTQEQLQVLASDGVPVLTLSPADILAGTADLAPLETALAAGPAAVTMDVSTVDHELSSRIAARLATALGSLAGARPLMLTGGETAREVLDALGVRRLSVLGEIEHGAVLSVTPGGDPVVTRPGSFGDPSSLKTILAALGRYPESPLAPSGLPSSTHSPLPAAIQPPLPEKGPSMNIADPAKLPLVAVTMGDGAGVGPEVVVAAVLDPQIGNECRPVVIGDVQRLRQAAEILGIHADIHAVDSVRDMVFSPDRVNVIDLALLPADLPWGKLSPVAGHAAYEYIRVASELAMGGEVQAICTAPLNKEALHAAGHVFPGHTELLAQLTGTEEVSMMLSTPKIKVIHVTTHIGLMDAVRKINPALVERTILRGHEALIRAGIPQPKIGVCAINPHAGEGGLFGQGEEAEKIEPGVQAARDSGVDVTGPLPADTLFFLAGRGDYDLVVAMYHDQGHGPVKVLGIEAGVNITVGLPVIRTSVDHGTAFDIAGKGTADPRSMVEALHQAAEMATRPIVAI